MKVGGLLVKTLAKPVARQLKVDAEHVGWLREACTSIGQTTNYLTSRLTHASSLDKWKKPYKHIELKATEAREKGAEIVSEGFVLTVAVTVMGYEYNRQNNYKEAAARRKEEKEAAKAARKEAKQADKRAALQRRQSDMLQMLRSVPFVEVSIESAAAVGSDSHVTYSIRLAVPHDAFRKASHVVGRRYSEFAALHDALAKSWGRKVELPRLPAKRFTLGGLSERQVEERRRGLEEYLTQLVAILNWSLEQSLRDFFEVDGWLKERRPKVAAGGEPDE